ncbi:hypothetical protein CONLIGDRAFT_493564 [Coniochaeta ligniaria NRRL 30616]|uniref:Uncharacterized protein n=1 Tax=Coniochaeta ligniaria NRRL 30616 TaxID=1408157 RepID=A0A1J7IGX3_9PEZI|nr:hypothetical protein CONLIGDRAFT_493564 [Coniochaeta ligniaria NRRL 30616]
MRVFASVHAFQPLSARHARRSLRTVATPPHQPDWHRIGGTRVSSGIYGVQRMGEFIGLPNPTVLSWRRGRYDTGLPSLQHVGVPWCASLSWRTSSRSPNPPFGAPIEPAGDRQRLGGLHRAYRPPARAWREIGTRAA